MIQSMTAFASQGGAEGATSWTWEMRGVNGRGLDLRLRLPDGIAGLEAAARARLSAALTRGNVTLGLRLARDEAATPLALDDAQLDRVLRALETVQDRARARGVALAQPTAADLLSVRGVVRQDGGDGEEADLLPPLLADLDRALSAFCAMRAGEGAALERILLEQLDRIAALTDAAAEAAAARAGEARAALTAALRRVVEDAPEVEEGRVAQELAMLAVKADVTEEIDRLRAHVVAARELIADASPAGRRLDFLAQEFNREANTLCSKAGSAALTRIGLDLKAEIDRMREQMQNVE